MLALAEVHFNDETIESCYYWHADVSLVTGISLYNNK